jgi:hypothetical protein
MTLVMPSDHVETGLGVGARVDLIAGQGSEQVVIARDVELLALQEGRGGLQVQLLLTGDHRTHLLGGRLPEQPRVVAHQ